MEYQPTLKKKYNTEIIPEMKKDFGYKSVMQVPVLEKIVLNQGIGKAVADKKLIDIAEKELSIIAGQKAVRTLSKKDISNFKLRKKMPIGVRVTLRKQKTRWGSCSSVGNLNFNWRLIMAPIEVIDYVVVHEICHLKEMNHSSHFWKLVEESISYHKKAKKWLKEYHYLLRV